MVMRKSKESLGRKKESLLQSHHAVHPLLFNIFPQTSNESVPIVRVGGVPIMNGGD